MPFYPLPCSVKVSNIKSHFTRPLDSLSSLYFHFDFHASIIYSLQHSDCLFLIYHLYIIVQYQNQRDMLGALNNSFARFPARDKGE